MKKLKLSIGALLLATSGYCTEPTNNELIKEMYMTTEDIIKSMRITNDTVTQCYTFVRMSEIYVHNLLDVLSKLEDLKVLNCENCDEID